MKWIQRKEKIKPKKTDTPIERIAKVRGINNVDEFLNPQANVLNDPYLLMNVEDASNRIIRAIANGERITTSYDADVDGVTSNTIMLRYLSNYTDKLNFIYNERNHGHGIHEQTRLDFIGKKDVDEDGNIINEDKKNRYERNKENLEIISNTDLLIIIDSSSNDAKACKHLREEYGVDIVILDHHAIERSNEGVILVNPQQKDDKYPNKALSGAGVVFKVIEVMEDTLDSVDIWQYIDLVAVGI